MTEFSIPFFVERAHYPTRVNQAFRNPSPLCANWQSPAEEFHNNFDDIYSAFFLYFFFSPSFLPFENEKRLNTKCWNYRDLGTKKFVDEWLRNGGVDSGRVEWSTRLLHFERGLRDPRNDGRIRARIVAFSRPMNWDWKKLVSLERVLQGENKMNTRKIISLDFFSIEWYISDNRGCHIWLAAHNQYSAVHLLFLTNETI